MWPPACQRKAAVCEQCELSVQEPRCDLRSEQGRTSYGWRRVEILDGSRAIGRAKKGGRNSYGEFGTGSTLSCSSRRVQELVEWCCSCTQNSTCSTTVLSTRSCECRNAGWQCTGCYFWGKCKNKGRLMPSPTTMRGLLGIFPRGADPRATNPRTTTLPVQSPTSSSLRAISVARAGGRSTRGGARSYNRTRN